VRGGELVVHRLVPGVAYVTPGARGASLVGPTWPARV